MQPLKMTSQYGICVTICMYTMITTCKLHKHRGKKNTMWAGKKLQYTYQNINKSCI